MKTVGLAGGIGSGKSLVSQIFFHLGIPVFNADRESGLILDNDLNVRTSLCEWFGDEVYLDGKPDRPKLAAIVFRNPEMLARMNGLLHPKVMERFIEWRRVNNDHPYVLHEASILFESGFYRQMDSTILVTAPEEIRIIRVMARDQTTAESVRLRMKNQWPDEQKIPLADFIIRNDGVTPLIPRILEIHNKLTDK